MRRVDGFVDGLDGDIGELAALQLRKEVAIRGVAPEGAYKGGKIRRTCDPRTLYYFFAHEQLRKTSSKASVVFP